MHQPVLYNALMFPHTYPGGNPAAHILPWELLHSPGSMVGPGGKGADGVAPLPQLFKGKFYHCLGVDIRNITNRSDCVAANYKWVHHKYNFDNLGQVSVPAAHISDGNSALLLYVPLQVPEKSDPRTRKSNYLACVSM